MIFQQLTEEFVAKVADYKVLTAIVTHTKEDDGTVEIKPSVSLMGLRLNYDEATRLLEALPRAMARAGAMAAKVALDVAKLDVVLKSVPYEEPKVTPVGNMRDLLSEVCHTSHDDDDTTKVSLSVLSTSPTICKACAYSGIEPQDMDLSCGHPDAGTFGVSLRREPAEHCPDRIKFQQHPLRNPDGTLKPTTHDERKNP